MEIVAYIIAAITVLAYIGIPISGLVAIWYDPEVGFKLLISCLIIALFCSQFTDIVLGVIG